MQQSRTSKLAIVAIFLGVSSIGLLILTGLPALFVGYTARSNIHRSDGSLKGHGMAKAGIILGWIGTILTVPITVVGGYLFFFWAPKPVPSGFLVHDLRNAIVAFRVEYGKYPSSKISNSKDIYVRSDANVMNALLGSGPGSSTLNPQGIEFILISPRLHSVDSKGNHSYFNLHRSLYHIIFDSDGDGAINDPFTGAIISEEVLVWSDGADGVGGTADDWRSW